MPCSRLLVASGNAPLQPTCNHGLDKVEKAKLACLYGGRQCADQKAGAVLIRRFDLAKFQSEGRDGHAEDAG